MSLNAAFVNRLCWVMFKYWMSVSGVKSRNDLLDVLLSLSVSHMDVYFPVSTKSPLPPVHLCLRLCLSINVCLCASVFLCVFSPLFSFLCRSLCPYHWLSLSQPSVKTSQEHHSVNFFLCPLLCPLNWFKLASHSFFLLMIILAHSCWVILFLITTNKNLRRS